ncbi:hypothetical protein OCH239_17850 [Roseivivax halodurans JCM 10272]|uniref:Uncharacterized protein n=1 Tax=Roseivivax halodurans JCM 10272 TaxID=1449350 RepID=X7EJE2_9RHOB|nr:hypothetical protein OCH239_17850 [Roseivivax halodurans JCM 10272]
MGLILAMGGFCGLTGQIGVMERKADFESGFLRSKSDLSGIFFPGGPRFGQSA